MKNIINQALLRVVVALAAMIGASAVHAEAKNKIIFDDAYAIFEAQFNPFNVDLKGTLPDGVIFTTVNGSTDPAYFQNNHHGQETLTFLDGTPLPFLLIPTTHHICLAVKDNRAIVWDVIEDDVILPNGYVIFSKGDLRVSLFTRYDNTDPHIFPSGELRALNFTQATGVKSISDCDVERDASYVKDVVEVIKGAGVIIKQGIE